MDDVQHLTILGDRQAGKTKLLVDIAIDEAARQGRRVLFFTASRAYDSWTLKLIEARSRELVPQLVEQVYYSNGRERIRYTTGGLLFFRQDQHHSVSPIDTHIIDDVSGGESCVGANRIYRAVLR